MSNSFDCISGAYDVHLLALAVGVCLMSSLAVFNLLARVIAERTHAAATILLVLATVTAAADIWTTHFICMVAYHPAVDFGVSAHVTAISLLLLLVVVGMAFTCVIRASRLMNACVAGVFVGLAIATMHYADIRGSYLGEFIVWSGWRVALSVGLSLSFATSAIFVFGQGETLLQTVGASLLLSLGIVSTHFASMSAMKLLPGSTTFLPADFISGSLLGYAAAAVSVLVIGSGVAAFFLDLHTRRESDDRFRFQARHDRLTGLPNRLFFEEAFEREIVGHPDRNRSAALFCIDLDGFKQVNDTFGHLVGDSVLVEVARRLQAILGERCVAARLGGDEFALMVTGLGPAKTAAGAAELVLDVLKRSFVISESLIDIGCSIGIALYPEHGTAYPALLGRADLALSAAKAEGRGAFRFFEPDMEAHSRTRATLAKELRAALSGKQFHLAYQPKTYVASGAVSGFEALLRWSHPERGPVSPATFIPVAEESGLILQIGEWVLREACREAASWDNLLSVAVNFSPAQFRQSDLVNTIRDILDETGLDPRRLEIEITESLFFESSPRSLKVLNQIKELGVSIAIDDFGTGFSCLSTLQSFEFDTIKIDKSFVDRIEKSSKATSIVLAILHLAASLDMTVVAEGVEHREQFEFLARNGCAQIQGHLFGAARPIEHYSHLLCGALQADVA